MKPLIFGLALSPLALFEAAGSNPVEVGTVSWLRDYDQAIAQSKSSNKPIFLLFQEVPGCAGCKQFGQEVLSDPSVVQTIEKNFVPLLIHNNKPGKDADVLKRFNEPAWNYQVVRFLDSTGKDLIPRKDRVWDSEGITQRMKEALQKAGRSTASNTVTSRVAFAQHCFWTGEMKLGAIEGVKRTEAGFFDGREVTLVDYDPNKIPLTSLISKARSAGVGDQLYLTDSSQSADYEKGGYGAAGSAKLLNSQYRSAPASDQKKQLQGTPFAKLNLTPEQSTKVNAFARSSPREAIQYLNPSQTQSLSQPQ